MTGGRAVRLAGWVIRTLVYARTIERSIDRAVVHLVNFHRAHVP